MYEIFVRYCPLFFKSAQQEKQGCMQSSIKHSDTDVMFWSLSINFAGLLCISSVWNLQFRKRRTVWYNAHMYKSLLLLYLVVPLLSSIVFSATVQTSFPLSAFAADNQLENRRQNISEMWNISEYVKRESAMYSTF